MSRHETGNLLCMVRVAENFIHETARGGIAGLIATVPMTAAMKLLHTRLPPYERYPLPPRQITMRVTEKLGLDRPRTGLAKKSLTLVSHFSYGAAAGGIYRLLTRRAVRPGLVSGVAFGLAVWAGSYLGLLPAAGILSPATRHRPRRVALMIASHVVWGLALGELTRRMDGSPSRIDAASRDPQQPKMNQRGASGAVAGLR